MGFSDYLERGVLTEIFGVESKCPPKWEKPKRYWIAFCKAEVNDDDTGCTIVEPPRNYGYERVESKYWGFAQMDFGEDMVYQHPYGSNTNEGPRYTKLSLTPTEQCPCGSDQSTEIYNTMEIIFPKAKEDWGEIVYIAVCDQKINGNVLCYGKLEEPMTILKGQIFQVKKGMIVVGVQGTMDNSPSQTVPPPAPTLPAPTMAPSPTPTPNP